MALTIVLTGCNSGNTPAVAPVIDESACTVNGKKYDNEVYKCWLLEWSYEYSYSIYGQYESDKQNGSEYVWLTEFQARSLEAETNYYYSSLNISVPGAKVTTKGSTKLTEQKGKDENSCDEE